MRQRPTTVSIRVVRFRRSHLGLVSSLRFGHDGECSEEPRTARVRFELSIVTRLDTRLHHSHNSTEFQYSRWGQAPSRRRLRQNSPGARATAPTGPRPSSPSAPTTRTPPSSEPSSTRREPPSRHPRADKAALSRCTLSGGPDSEEVSEGGKRDLYKNQTKRRHSPLLARALLPKDHPLVVPRCAPGLQTIARGASRGSRSHRYPDHKHLGHTRTKKAARSRSRSAFLFFSKSYSNSFNVIHL